MNVGVQGLEGEESIWRIQHQLTKRHILKEFISFKGFARLPLLELRSKPTGG